MQNFIPKKELKVWVRVISDVWGDTIRYVCILVAQWLTIEDIDNYNKKTALNIIVQFTFLINFLS